MPRQVQDRVLELVESALETTLAREVSPDWLKRPGVVECGDLWPLVQSIYADLTGWVLPEVMPPRERRRIDAVLTGPDGIRRIVEVDETQHFTPPRARTLALYPAAIETAFDRDEWAQRASAATRLPSGGFARPRPPLFPEQGGRHQQRAFRDALADLLPSIHGWAPTLRIGDFEVKAWMHGTSAHERMADLLTSKGVGTA